MRYLEDEVTDLRRRLEDLPGQSRGLESRLADAQRSLAAVSSQNERLAQTLREARDQITSSRRRSTGWRSRRRASAPSSARNDDDSVDVFTGGRKLRVNVSPAVELDGLVRGQEVMLNEALNVVAALDFEQVGEVVMLKEILADGERALVIANADEERVVRLAEPLCAEDVTIRAGDSLLLDTRAGYVYERVPKSEVEELVLEEVPDIDYAQIGGLATQIEAIRDAVELPYLHPELFKEHELKPPKGVLLYGPPGCGKTLIAKAVANSLAKKVAERTGAGGASPTSSTSRAPSCSTSTSARPSGTSAWSSSGPARRPATAPRSSSSSTRWTRSSAPAAPACPPTWRTRSFRSCSARSTASRRSRTSWSSAPPTART